MKTTGKRAFTLKTSRFLKQVEKTKEPLVITDRGEPVLILEVFRKEKIENLAGFIKDVKVKGDINDPILPPFNEWDNS